MRFFVLTTALLACALAIVVEIVMLPAKVVSLVLTNYASAVADKLDLE